MPDLAEKLVALHEIPYWNIERHGKAQMDDVAALYELKRQLSAFLPEARPESGGYHPMAA